MLTVARDQESMTSEQVDLSAIEAGIAQLLRAAVEVAISLEELLDCAHGAAALGDRAILELVVARLQKHVGIALDGSELWGTELAYSKLDGWTKTGHRARLLAEIFGLIAPPLR